LTASQPSREPRLPPRQNGLEVFARSTPYPQGPSKLTRHLPMPWKRRMRCGLLSIYSLTIALASGCGVPPTPDASTPLTRVTPTSNPEASPSFEAAGGWEELSEPSAQGRVSSVGAITNDGAAFWGGGTSQDATDLADGALFDVAGRSWSRIPSAPIGPRSSPVVAWTGNELIVWGGFQPGSESASDDGARYNPRTNVWTTLPLSPIPGRIGAWTGDSFLVVSTVPDADATRLTAATWDPSSDGWQLGAEIRMPSGHDPAWAWTGTELVVFLYGDDIAVGPAGARYDPHEDAWTPTAPSPVDPLNTPPAFWVGDEVYVLSGASSAARGMAANAAYDPALDAWRAIEGPNASGFSLTEPPPAATNRGVFFFGNRPIEYIVASNVWLPAPPAPNGPRRIPGAAPAAGGGVVVWGGVTEPGQPALSSALLYETPD